MQFSAKEDLKGPIENVFALLSDFPGFERSALRRGVEVQRCDTLAEPGPGMAWDVAFVLRGKRRKAHLDLVHYDPPDGMVFDFASDNMQGRMVVDLVALSRGRTRMGVDFQVKPQNLTARLLLQSLKLAKGNLNKRFQVRMASYAEDMEERLKSMA